jgi:hypothetical protein
MMMVFSELSPRVKKFLHLSEPTHSIEVFETSNGDAGGLIRCLLEDIEPFFSFHMSLHCPRRILASANLVIDFRVLPSYPGTSLDH